MEDRAVRDEKGRVLRTPDRHRRVIKERVPAIAKVPVMTTKTVTRTEARPTGGKRLALRYDQLTLLMLAANRPS